MEDEGLTCAAQGSIAQRDAGFLAVAFLANNQRAPSLCFEEIKPQLPALRGAVRRSSVLLAATMVLVACAAARAEEAKDPPRWASLASNKVYLLQEPTKKNRILWIYHRRGLPVRITAQFEVWRWVTMPDGAEGWIRKAMLSSKRTVVVTGKTDVPIRESDWPWSHVVALAQPGVVAQLESCHLRRCEIKTVSTKGWIAEARIWGAGPP